MSGIYIPGIEMPTSCAACPCSYDNQCAVTNQYPTYEEWYESKPTWCPLIPVPEHGDLIDKSGVAVLSWTDGEYGMDFADGVLFVLDKLDELPVIIPAEGEDYEATAEEGEG